MDSMFSRGSTQELQEVANRNSTALLLFTQLTLCVFMCTFVCAFNCVCRDLWKPEEQLYG